MIVKKRRNIYMSHLLWSPPLVTHIGVCSIKYVITEIFTLFVRRSWCSLQLFIRMSPVVRDNHFITYKTYFILCGKKKNKRSFALAKSVGTFSVCTSTRCLSVWQMADMKTSAQTMRAARRTHEKSLAAAVFTRCGSFFYFFFYYY